MKQPVVYILASKPLGTLYIGVTSDLSKRMAEHTQGLIQG
ncbi:MAG TPA: GIY-YIG nuclease family protein, partial [Hyphomicrobium zavarzinii]|nr:GIY-YIG nuclease family protein [Hyphomicrobium zavarzinii]